MRQDIKERWVAALRSGDYKQGKNALHDTENDKYCCLGVLCDLAVREGVTSAWVTGSRMKYGDAFSASHSYLPKQVREWSGLATADPHMDNGMMLSYLNDRGFTFAQIADLIEEQL